MYLGSEEIRKLIKNKKLVTGYIDLEKQLQPNGFDLTIQKIGYLEGNGEILADGKQTPEVVDVPSPYNKWWCSKGIYLITFNEVLKFPKGIAGIGIQRSSVIRCGAMINVSSWDSGYEGRGQNLLVVFNEKGITLEKNARIVQMQFIRIAGKNFQYKGHYLRENMKNGCSNKS